VIARGFAACARLAFQRTIGPVAVAVLLAAGLGAVDSSTAPAVLGAVDVHAREFAGAGRARFLGLGALLLMGALALAQHRLIARRVGGEETARRAAPLPAVIPVAGDLAGFAGAALAGWLALAFVAEAASDQPLEWREVTSPIAEPVVLLPESPSLLLHVPGVADWPAVPDVPDAPGGKHDGAHRSDTRIALELFALPGDGVVAALSAGVRRGAAAPGESAGPWLRREVRVRERMRVELDVPTGSGPLELALVRLGAGPPVGLARDGITLLARDAHPLGTPVSLALHGAALCVLGGAAAMALARAVGAGFAVALAAAGCLAALRLRLPIAGADLGAALERIGAGLAPGMPSAPALAVLAVFLCVALPAAAGRPHGQGGER